MGLFDQAKSDIEDITSNGEDWAVPVTLQPPGRYFDYTLNFEFNIQPVTVKGINKDHHLAVEPETGRTVNSKMASVSISEQNLIDAGLDVRNDEGEVDLKNFLATVTNDNGDILRYKIDQWYPDESIGLIVCILQEAA